MIVKYSAWNSIIINAQKALSTSMVYHSIVDKKAYKIITVDDEKITIDRASGGENDILTKNNVFKAIEKFNKTGGKMRRRTLLSPTVARETTLVLFCTYLCWTEDGFYIMEI